MASTPPPGERPFLLMLWEPSTANGDAAAKLRELKGAFVQLQSKVKTEVESLSQGYHARVQYGGTQEYITKNIFTTELSVYNGLCHDITYECQVGPDVIFDDKPGVAKDEEAKVGEVDTSAPCPKCEGECRDVYSYLPQWHAKMDTQIEQHAVAAIEDFLKAGEDYYSGEPSITRIRPCFEAMFRADLWASSARPSSQA